MNEHGLGHWLFQWDRARRRAGACHHGKKMISLSYHYVSRNEEADIRNTILHEIAHAICGFGEGHGTIWKRTACQIGAKPERCYPSRIDMPSKYSATCPSCGKVYYRNRLGKGYRYNCRQCGKERGILTYK